MPNTDVGLIAMAVAEVAKVVGQWQASADRRKMKAAIDAGESYIFVNEKIGEYANLDDARQKKLLAHFRKRFFAHNN